MHKYIYIATYSELCDFCLELLVLCGVARVRELNRAAQEGKKWEWSHNWGCILAPDRYVVVQANEFEYTMNDLLDIMDRARLEYEKFYPYPNYYFASDVVKEFKIRFMGNKPLNRLVIEYWIQVFTHLSFRELSPWEYKLIGPSAVIQPNLKSVVSLETIPYSNIGIIPDIGIWDVHSAYYLNPIHICSELYIYGTGYTDAFEIDPTRSSLLFTPAKFITLIYTITQLVNDTSLLMSEKYMLLFKLTGRVFGIGDEYMVMWTLSVLFRYCSTQQDLGMFMESPVEYNDYNDESLATEFGIVKNVMFTPEAKKIFDVYMADQEDQYQRRKRQKFLYLGRCLKFCFRFILGILQLF